MLGIKFGIKSDLYICEAIMPKNMRNPIILVGSVWDTKNKKGYTTIIRVNTRSFFQMEKNTPIRIGEAKTKAGLKKMHKDTIRKLRNKI